jgi:lysophospholipase L1-like esterase
MTAPHDLDVLAHDELALLLEGAPWRRLAVVGDSIAEGVREPHPGYRDLSWIDRVAEPLADVAPGLEVLNLGRRGLLAREVRDQQLAEALAFEPDLAIVAAGGNDTLARAFDPAGVRAELEAIVRPLRRAGADVLMIELLDIVRSGLVAAEHRAAVDERLGRLADVTRSVAMQHGAVLVQMRGHPASADPGIYSSDRLHLNARGHAIVGTEAVRCLAAAIGARVAA